MCAGVHTGVRMHVWGVRAGVHISVSMYMRVRVCVGRVHVVCVCVRACAHTGAGLSLRPHHPCSALALRTQGQGVEVCVRPWTFAAGFPGAK